MEDLKNIPTENLLEMLATHTAEYVHMIKEGAADNEFSRLEFLISMIQHEIKFRGTSTATSTLEAQNNALSYK